MKQYFIEVKTDIDLGTIEFVESLLTDWCYNINLKLRIEYFDLGEPIRKSFNEMGIEYAINYWVSNGTPLLLKRKSKPKFDVDIQWRREKGLDKRKFPWRCAVWLNYDAGDKLALELFHFIINHFHPSFGYITTYDDIKEKHFIMYKSKEGTVEQFIGRDINEDEQIIPGVYWINFYGKWAIDKLGAKHFSAIPAYDSEKINEGYIVTIYSESNIIGSPEAKEAERKILYHFGEDKFFNIKTVDIESLK